MIDPPSPSVRFGLFLVFFLALWQVDSLREAVLAPPSTSSPADPSSGSDDFWDAYASLQRGDAEEVSLLGGERVHPPSSTARFDPRPVRIPHVPIA